MQKNAETRKLISIAGGRREQLDGNARRDQSLMAGRREQESG